MAIVSTDASSGRVQSDTVGSGRTGTERGFLLLPGKAVIPGITTPCPPIALPIGSALEGPVLGSLNTLSVKDRNMVTRIWRSSIMAVRSIAFSVRTGAKNRAGRERGFVHPPSWFKLWMREHRAYAISEEIPPRIFPIPSVLPIWQGQKIEGGF